MKKASNRIAKSPTVTNRTRRLGKVTYRYTADASIGYAIVRAGEYETVDEVVFAQPGDRALLGSHTL